MTVLSAMPLVAFFGMASAFVPPTTLRQAAPAQVGATAEYVGVESTAPSTESGASTPWGSCLLMGLGLGYAAAAAGAYNRQGANRTSRPALEQAKGSAPGQKKFLTGAYNRQGA